jgi:hypothetical protein
VCLVTSSSGSNLNCGAPCRVIVTASLAGALDQSMTINVSEKKKLNILFYASNKYVEIGLTVLTLNIKL